MRLLKLAAGAAALLLAGQAHAATWLVNYTSTSGSPVHANLKLTASDTKNAAGGFDVTKISGDVDGDLVAGLIDNPNHSGFSYSADGLFMFDNMVFADEQGISWYGLLFEGKSGNEYNLFADNASTYELYAAKGGSYLGNSMSAAGEFTAFSAGFVPEPAAWTMMIMGFGGIGAMLRRRKQALVSA